MPAQPPKKNAPPNKTAALALIEGKALRYIKARDEIKVLKKDQDAISSELKELAIKHGEKTPATGSSKGTEFSYVLDLPSATVSNTAVIKTVVDQDEALKVLMARGGQQLVERCTKRVIDEAMLALVFQEGLIDMADIDSFSSEGCSRRINVEEK